MTREEIMAWSDEASRRVATGQVEFAPLSEKQRARRKVQKSTSLRRWGVIWVLAPLCALVLARLTGWPH